MAKHKVTLDALIVREDLEVDSATPDRPGGDVANIGISELEQGRSMFDVLRKPDFQRETSEWSPEQIVELVKNVLDEELVPAVIVWKAPNRNVFVIDGAHRLSALIAWVNDDYGDKAISLKFYGGVEGIPKAQLEAAKATRKLMDETIGSYQDLAKFRKEGAAGTVEQIRRGRSAAASFVAVQCVRNDATHAEASFYRINQGGAVIDETEKEIIHARRRSEALAARALLRAGTGHRYWWAFDAPTKTQIEALAKSIYETLYRPEQEEPFRTIELPMAGGGYSAGALAVLYEFIHIANELPRRSVPKPKKSRTLEPLPKTDPERDTDGAGTLKYLKRVKLIAEQINSDTNGSLGLHPAVYSYSATGKFQPTAFFAQVQFLQHLNKHDLIASFTISRREFEEFLITYKYFINLLVVAYGAGIKSLAPLTELHILVFDQIRAGKPINEVKNIVLSDARFAPYLREITPGLSKSSQNFSSETKTAIRLKDALKNAPRCAICGARYHPNSTSIDHIKEKRSGGLGSMDNGRVTHVYCNQSREKLEQLGLKAT